MAGAGAAGSGAQRLVGTLLVLVCASVRPAVAGADAAGPVGPLWWAVPLQVAALAAVAGAARAAVRGTPPDRAASAGVAVTVVALASGVLLHRAGLVGAAPGAPASWPYHLVVLGLTCAAVRCRRWPTAPALAVLVALTLALAWLRSQPPVRAAGTPAGTAAGLHATADAAFLLALVLTLFGALAAVEEVSGLLRSARATADADVHEAAELAAAEAERTRWEAVVHDDVLGVLSAASTVTTSEHRAALARAAATALRRIAALQDEEDPGDDAPPAAVADVAGRLAAAVERVRPGTPVRVDARSGLVPGAVADALVDATSELVRNVVRHAAGARAQVTGRLDAATARVEVRDDGPGFVPDTVPDARLGLRVSVTGPVLAVGGAVRVTSSPGAGTVAVLEWPA